MSIPSAFSDFEEAPQPKGELRGRDLVQEAVDVGSREGVKALNEANKKEIAREHLVLRAMLQNSDTRWWLKRLIYQQCGLGRSPYVKDSFDGTSFNLGQQNIGNSVFAELQAAAEPELITKFLKEPM